MSTTAHDNIHWLPPQQQQRFRFALLLQGRRALRRAIDAGRQVPRAAAEFMGHLSYQRLLTAPSRLLSMLRGSLTGLVAPMAGWARQHPLAAAAGLLLTSARSRALIAELVEACLSGLRAMGGRMLGLAAAGLNKLGTPGQTVHRVLRGWHQRMKTLLVRRGAPVWFLAQALWGLSKTIREGLLGLVRSYLTHKVLARIVHNRVRRIVLEAIVIPTIANSRIVRWLKTPLHQVADLAQDDAGAQAAPATRTAPPAPAADETTAAQPSLWDEEAPSVEEPLPGNRAERRAAQQAQARQNKRPRAA